MSTTNDHSDDLPPHKTPPSKLQTPEQPPSEPSRTQNALVWATVGLSVAFCITGVVLSLTGHDAAGGALITVGAGFLGGVVSARK